jgi:UDP:flavonoid glycosyltransferase YjiC (YdhE family)
MAKILLAWELGLGFGHLGPYLDLIRRLKKEKHKVFFAARDVGNAERVFGSEVVMLQAPFNPRGVSNPIRVARTHAHLLHNIGFNDPVLLTGRIRAWQEIYNYVKPDLVIYDHSPTAQLAMRHTKAKQVLCGTGFTVPPGKVPMPNMRFWENADQDKLLVQEKNIIDQANLALKGLKLPELVNVAMLMEVDATLLMTFKEIDHYNDRGEAEYVGIPLTKDYGDAPNWPAGGKFKVFAYLYPFKTLPSLLESMTKLNISAIIYAPEVQQALKAKFKHPRLSFVEQPLRMGEVAQQCDVAITNGTHGTTVALLLAGKPILALPQNLERVLVSHRVREMGAGLVAPQLKPEGMDMKLKAILTNNQFRLKAQAFASKYADFTLQKHLDRIMEILESNLAAGK